MKNTEGKLEKEKEENILKRKNIFAEKEKENIFGEGKYFFSRGYFAETQGFKVSRSRGLQVSRS